MVFTLSRNKADSSSLANDLVNIFRWLRPGFSIHYEPRRDNTDAYKSDQIRSTTRNEDDPGMKYVTVIPQFSKRTSTKKQKSHLGNVVHQANTTIEPIRSRQRSGSRGREFQTSLKTRSARSPKVIPDDDILTITPSTYDRPQVHRSNAAPDKLQAQPQKFRTIPSDSITLEVAEPRNHRHSRTRSREPDAVEIVPFPPRKSSRSHSRRRSSQNTSTSASGTIGTTLLEFNTPRQSHNSTRNNSESRHGFNSDRRNRSRSISHDRSSRHRRHHQRQRTPSPLPELDGNIMDSPASVQYHELGTPSIEHDIQVKNMRQIKTLLGVNSPGRYKHAQNPDYDGADPIIYDESQHEPEDFYNPSFSPGGHSPLKSCLKKPSEQGSQNPTIKLAPPAFDLPIPLHRRPDVHELPVNVSKITQTSPTFNISPPVSDAPCELSAETHLPTSTARDQPSARPCVSYERLRPVPPNSHRRVVSENSTPTRGQCSNESNPAASHTRSASTYSYTPTRETRADRKSFNTIRFVDSSGTSHEKLRRVLGI